MNNYQLNRTKMYRNVTDFLARQTSEIFKMPAFTNSYNTIVDCMEVKSQENSIQSLHRWGDSPEKKKRRKALLGLMCHATAILTAYAKLTGNNILFAEVKFTPWQLGRVHQVQLPMVAGILYERAQQNLDKLGDYGFTRELLNDFRKAIDEYSESIPFPRVAKVTSTLATKKMEEYFKKADDALEMLDLLAESEKYSDQSFWNGYRSSRKMVREGRVKMALKVQAVNKADGTPVARAFLLSSFVNHKERHQKPDIPLRRKPWSREAFTYCTYPRENMRSLHQSPATLQPGVKSI